MSASAIQEAIDFLKEDGELSETPVQVELAETAQVEFDQLTKLKDDAHAHLVELGMTMPCGHLARYAVNGEDGTQYCSLCLCNAVTGTTDPKIQAKIAEIINHD